MSSASRWVDRHTLFAPSNSFWWSKTHAMVPTPYKLDENLFRIYFSGRNADNQSHIGWFNVDLRTHPRVVEQSLEPVLSPGSLGCFDDNGVSPSCVIRLPSGELALYYIGWNPGSTVRMNLFGGLAISLDDGLTFERWSRAPILERTKADPLLNTAPWVVKTEHGFRMYYVSGVDWLGPDFPRYNIKVAHSSDGFTWNRKGHVVLDFADQEFALARPFVIWDRGVWRMWFSAKSEVTPNYRVLYAESEDGIKWNRGRADLGLTPQPNELASQMVEYGIVIEAAGEKWLLYNGDNYGEFGIGIARLSQ